MKTITLSKALELIDSPETVNFVLFCKVFTGGQKITVDYVTEKEHDETLTIERFILETNDYAGFDLEITDKAGKLTSYVIQHDSHPEQNTWHDITLESPPFSTPVIFTNGKLLFIASIEKNGIFTHYPDEDFEYYDFLQIKTEQLIKQRCITHWMQLPPLPATPVETNHRILNSETMATPVETNPASA